MTTDKLTSALVAIIEAIKPDDDITVRDARSMGEIDLPTIAIDVKAPEKHSLAMPGVMKCGFDIIMRCHGGDDDSRATITSWANTLEQELNEPSEIRDAVTNEAAGMTCHFIQVEGGSTKWDDTTMETTFSGEAWIVRTA